MRHPRAVAGTCLTGLLLAGCTHPHPSASPPAPLASAKPAAASAPKPSPPQVLPDTAELQQELSIVASPQISRDQSLLPAGRVQDLGGGWVRYGPGRAGPAHRVIQKTGQADVPFTAQVVVTHLLDFSDVFPTKTQAARAPLRSTQEWTTVYRYEYDASGTWNYKDEQDGAVIAKSRT